MIVRGRTAGSVTTCTQPRGKLPLASVQGSSARTRTTLVHVGTTQPRAQTRPSAPVYPEASDAVDRHHEEELPWGVAPRAKVEGSVGRPKPGPRGSSRRQVSCRQAGSICQQQLLASCRQLQVSSRSAPGQLVPDLPAWALYCVGCRRTDDGLVPVRRYLPPGSLIM